MKRTISSVLALAMVAALLAIFAGAASAEVTEPSGQIAVINGASADPVTASANGTQIGGDLAYAGDAQPQGQQPGGEVQTVDPIRNRDTKVGRNDPCPCGSGKKFKQCCGKS